MYQDNYQRQTKCIDDQDKFQSVKDTDNSMNNVNSMNVKHQGKSSNQLAFRLDNLQSDKKDMQKKVNVLVRLLEAME